MVGGDRTTRRQCHDLGNGVAPIRSFVTLRRQLKEILSELTSRFPLFKPRAPLHFDPVEYPITKEELAVFQKVAMRSGRASALSTWMQWDEDEDSLGMSM